MRILTIETATRALRVAIIEGPATIEETGSAADRLLVHRETDGLRAHGHDLPLLVEGALKSAHLSLKQLDGVVVDIGPGSFAGLRIGVAYAKGLAMGAGLPIATVCSLDVIAANAPKDEEAAICSLLDAKQQKVYFARYVFRGPREYRQSPALLTIEEVITRCAGAATHHFLGDGITPYREVLTAALGDRAQFAPETQWYPRVEMAAHMGIVAFRAGKRSNPKTLVPMYLYPWDCSIKGGQGTTETLPQPPHIEVRS